MKEAFIAIAVIAAIAGFFIVRRSPSSSGSFTAIQPGALCTVDDGEGWFRVAKVLVLDDRAVHIRLYANRWKHRPTLAEIEAAKLTLGSINDKEAGFGMGHLPLSRQSFAGWQAAVLKVAPVADDELEGYKLWKESNGGVF